MELISNKPLHLIWLKAAVVGSLWASVEIILGSFLHNLRIPFSGAILSFFGVYLVISFFQIWKENGIIWRAGLICALMKSISPSAIILGPMIGIFLEAVLIEFYILIFGKNILGYMIGGAFAVFSTLFQKLMNLIILYGFDFIHILKAFYDFFIKQIRLPALSPVYLIIFITGIYVLAGMIAAALGYRSGIQYIRHRVSKGNTGKIPIHSERNSFQTNILQGYSLYYLVLAAFTMTLCLFLLNTGLILPALITAVAYLVFCIYRYGNTLRRLMKISLWIQFFLITILAAFLWNGISGKAFFSLNGLMVGLKMVLRAIVFITGFSAVSIELRNPLIKSLLYKKGFSSLYQALSLAFSALPGIISSMPETKVLLKNPFQAFSVLFQLSEGLLKQFESDDRFRSPVIIITGEIQQGKTNFVRSIVHQLQSQGYRISGFLAPAVFEDDRRVGFNLFDIQTSEIIDLCSLKSNPDWIKQRSFYFNPMALEKGNEILSGDRLDNAQLLIIDEIGPLELSNQGWSKAIGDVCQTSRILQLWVVRKSLVEKVARNWNVGDVFIFEIDKDSREAVISKLEDLLRSGV